MAATTDLLTKVGLPGSATTLDSPGFTIGNTTINVGNTANWQTETKQVFAMDQVTIESGKEVRVAGSYREIEGIVTSATSIGSMSFASGFSPRNYPAGSTTRVYIPVSSTRENQLVDWGKQDHNLKGNHKTLTDDNGNEFLERGSVASAVNHVKVTNAITGGSPAVEATGDDTNVNLIVKGKGSGTALVLGAFKQGFLVNGKIDRTVASNNLTVAIKTLAGNTPSALDPVYVRIGNTVRTITAALSVTKNAGTNWCNAGSAEHATQDIDYFVYLGYNSTDGMTIGFSRIPYATTYADFNATSTNEKYAAISTIINAASTDEYELVGRFNAILSASAAYTWSVPATSVIVNRPIFETRRLSYVPTYSNLTLGNGTSTGQYIIKSRTCTVQTRTALGSTSSVGGAPASVSTPISIIQITASDQFLYGQARFNDNGVASYYGTVQTDGAGKFLPVVLNVSGTYPTIAGVTSSAPHAWGNTDEILIAAEYPINLT